MPRKSRTELEQATNKGAADEQSGAEITTVAQRAAPGAPAEQDEAQNSQEAPAGTVTAVGPPETRSDELGSAGDAAPLTPEHQVIDAFTALGLAQPLLQSIRELGFEEPTPIQRRAIPVLLSGRDAIAQAQTGTGKTAAFALPLLQQLDVDSRQVQALVLAPTRELAVQVAEAVHALGRHLEVGVLPIYGGQPIDRQLRALRLGVQVVIGTPGRIQDHLRRGSLTLDAVKTVVLDEADEMLDMGFEEEIEAILALAPERRQTALFSATIPPRVLALSRRYLRDAVRVTIEAEKLTVPTIKQTYYEVAPRAKLDALCRILDMEAPGSAIVFCRTKRDVDEIGEALMARGYPADTLHGDLSQAMRDRVMRRFRDGQAELLVATDVAARGLDIEHVSHVINFNIPEDPEQYVHRIGRTARAGRSGDAITLVTPREMRWLREIERLIRKRIKPARVPTAGDIAARRLELTKESITRAIREGGLESYLMAVEDLASDGDLTQVAAAALKVAMERDGGSSRVTVSTMAAEASAGVEPGRQRLFIDLGRKQGIGPSDIVGAIANEAGIPGRSIGAIDIYDNFTFVEVERGLTQRVIEALQGSTLHGKAFHIDVARPREEVPPEAQPESGNVRPAAVHVRRATPERDESEDAAAEQPPRQSAAAQGASVAGDEDEDEDEPPRRPAGWRDDAMPRSAQRYSRDMAARPSTRRPGQPREGFGGFRGAESRDTPPWQRRNQSDRPGYQPRSNERGEGSRPRWGDAGHGNRREESSFRSQGQRGFRTQREESWESGRRTEGPQGAPRRRPNSQGGQRQQRRRHDE